MSAGEAKEYLARREIPQLFEVGEARGGGGKAFSAPSGDAPRWDPAAGRAEGGWKDGAGGGCGERAGERRPPARAGAGWALAERGRGSAAPRPPAEPPAAPSAAPGRELGCPQGEGSPRNAGQGCITWGGGKEKAATVR